MAHCKNRNVPKRGRSVLLATLAGLLAVIMMPTLAEASATWRIVPSPNVAGTGYNNLLAVSCTGSLHCFAVGHTIGRTVQSTLIEKLSSGTWQIVPSPNPAGATGNELTGVSCTSASSCVAVGWSDPTGSPSTLIEQLSGGTWHVVPSPNPAGVLSSQLNAVSCSSSSACIAVGLSQTSSRSIITLVEQLSGGTWKVVPSPNVEGIQWNSLDGVSCSSSSHCVAVGQSTGNAGNSTLIEQLSAGSWNMVPSPNGDRLNSVSCTSSSACVAVGNSSIEQLSGGAWKIVPRPNPPPGQSDPLLGVSCINSSVCFAVGSTTGGTPSATLVEELSGGTWKILPSPSVAGVPASVLFAVSCRPAHCVAAGFSQASDGVVSTLIERN